VEDKSIQKSNNAYITVVDVTDVPEPVQSYRMSFKQAISRTNRQKEVIKALKDEIKSMESFEVMKPVHFKDIPE
jgi:hypothetical protein